MDNTDIDKKLAVMMKNLESFIARRGLSVPEFADQMGVSKTMVYYWIDGTHVMSLKYYLKAKEILQITDEDLEAVN